MLPSIYFGSLEISTWRLAALGSVVICWILFLIRSKKLGYPFYTIFPWLLFALPVGTLGAHLFNKIIPVLAGAESTSYPFSGLTVIGSIISVLLYSLLYIKYVMKIPPMQLMDAVAFTFPLSVLLGRIGCLLNGCCYGKIAPDSIKTSFLSVFTLPLDFYIPSSQIRHDYHGMPHDSLVWNLPLLFMLEAFAILVITEIMYHKREKWALYPGTVFASAGTLYSGGRFFLEFMRKDEMIGNTIFNAWQMATLVLFLFFSLWLCFSLYRRYQNLSRNKESI
ncbi:MAG: prolipoprotein diacylglyceryl transferase [Nitrospirae bacterium]|nr:prolipoprotein diacylglyceryl transferase [Nitrospirota bacterium]